MNGNIKCKKTSIGDIALVNSGQGAPQGDKWYNGSNIFVKAGNLNKLSMQRYVGDFCHRISDKAVNDHNLKLYSANSIVFPKSGMSVKTNNIALLKYDSYVVNHLAIITIIDTDECLPEYLYYLLKQSKISKLSLNESYPSIRLPDIKKFEVLLPPLDIQKEIVKILTEAEELKELREQSSSLTEEFLKSTFFKMFGDPISNPNGFKVGKISDIVIKTQYGTSKKANENKGIPILRMNNITYEGNWDFSSLKYIELNAIEKEKFMVNKGELLFNRTNSKELVGKSAVYRRNEPMAFAGYLVKLITQCPEDSEYIAAHLNSSYGKAYLFNMAKNIVGMANINAKEVQKIPILIPPVELRRKYAKIVEQVEEIKKTQFQSKKDIDELDNILIYNAFRGELIC